MARGWGRSEEDLGAEKEQVPGDARLWALESARTELLERLARIENESPG